MEAALRRSVTSAFQPALVARLFLVAVLLTTALLKAQRFVEFEGTLAASLLVPVGLVPVAAVGTIVVELATAVGLFFGTSQTVPVVAARLLFSTFISYHVWRWLMHIPVPCHCFGALFKLAPLQGIAINAFLLVLTFPLLAGNGCAGQTTSPPRPAPLG